MRVTIKHYGAFRKLGVSTSLDLPAPAPVSIIRAALANELGEAHRLLVEDSALANDTDILPDEFIIDDGCTLSVLPPVCGG
jgi:molybdopterin converting factor small subunit